MDLIKFLTDELDRETKRSRRTLEEVPDNQRSWKPHDRSMEFGYLADMVATIPTWVTMILTKDELDVAPAAGAREARPQSTTRADYLAALEKAATEARAALAGTSEAHLQTRMTVYLRLMGAKVPALYGPSADDTTFA